ncbi:MAG: RdgB/HAM1 family non-canonical purine NTP pyrophosphatase [Psittacicella sp.]
MNKIIVATHNHGKLLEIKDKYKNCELEFYSLKDFDIPSPVEDGKTFIENAIKKARSVFDYTEDFYVLADDSGLVVPALKGSPGIYSARFAGDEALDNDNINKLLLEMSSFEGSDRRAYMISVVVFMTHKEDPEPIIGVGRVKGCILNEKSGDKGFGYDPIFYVIDAKKTFGQMSIEEKAKYSHRTIALNSVFNILQDN